MSIDITNLRNRLEKQFENSELLGSDVVRFHKRYGGSIYATYYIDLGGHLQEKAGAIRSYQDSLLGPGYFEGPKNLQWNNYLCLVLPEEQLKNSEILKAKVLFERDRSYARKFVLSEGELEAFIDAPVAEANERDPSASILSTWAAKFRAIGAEDAVFSDDDLPAKIKSIEDATGLRKHAVRALKPARKSTEGLSFLSTLQLQNFRPAPAIRSFGFGKVNLIYGHNGTGKTSLFEAIEFLYCGRHKRNPDDSETTNWKIMGSFADGSKEAAEYRPASFYRQRNLDWYGQPEIKTNYLYQSFGRYNFFDTDAAVGFVHNGEEQAQLEENLSKVLVSADASQVWRNIERIYEAVQSHRNDAQRRVHELKIELLTVQGRIDTVAKFKKESELLVPSLRKLADRLSWDFAKIPDKELPNRLIGPLSEILALLNECSHFAWLDEKVSIARLRIICNKATALIIEIEPFSDGISKLQKAEKALSDQLASDRLALKELRELRRIVESGIASRHAELAKQNQLVSTFSDLFSEEGAEYDFSVFEKEDMGLNRLAEQMNEAHKRAEENARQAKTRLNQHQKNTDSVTQLSEELREIADRILETKSNKDECPLCHVQHRPGDLVRKMKQGLDEGLEKHGQALLKQSKEAQDALSQLSEKTAAIDWLIQFCAAARFVATRPKDCVGKLNEITGNYNQAIVRIKNLNKEIEGIEDRGLTIERRDLLVVELNARGVKMKSPGIAEIEVCTAEFEKRLEDGKQKVESYAKQKAIHQKKIEDLLASLFGESTEGPDSLTELKNWHASAQATLKELDQTDDLLTIPGNLPLGELTSQFTKMRALATDLQKALQKEAQAATELTDAEKRKMALEKAIGPADARVKRFTDVEKVFAEVIRNDSLTNAMQATIEENRGNIETIFKRIHTPADFNGLGKNIATLVRKADGKLANLSQVSTGQRAAYVVSIFLALNSRLKKAPPLILIDDPIAHVDDLNTLSFLDYLRDIALTNKRQIFFSTANDKIASLFERKFDFLGRQEFRRFDLPPKVG